MSDIVERLTDACVGHPSAEIPWPHRILHDAADEIESLRTHLAEAKAVIERQWLSVEDRVPELGQVVLVYEPACQYLPIHIDEWCELRESPVSFSSVTIPVGLGWAEADFEAITHWMPLPKPPQESDDAG